MNDTMYYLRELVISNFLNVKPDNLPVEIDEKELIQLIINNQMEYILFGSLLHVIRDRNNIEFIRNCIKRSMIRSLRQVNEINEIRNSFEKEGIYHQFLKGSFLKFEYPTPLMREMGDIDILVFDCDKNKISNLLQNLGYTYESSVSHHDVFIKDEFLILEVHNSLYDKQIDDNQYQYFKKEKNLIKVDGYQYSLENTKEDFYIYMVSHMAKHFYQKGCGIRNLLDIYIFRSKYLGVMNLKYIREEISRLGLVDFCNHIEKLSLIWLDNETNSNEFYESLFLHMFEGGIYGKDENLVLNHFIRENKHNKFINVLWMKLWYIFPSKEYLSLNYSWYRENTIILPFAWIKRGIKGLKVDDRGYNRQMLRTIDKKKLSKYQEMLINMNLDFKSK